MIRINNLQISFKDKKVIAPIEVRNAFICAGETIFSTFRYIPLDTTNVITDIIARISPNNSVSHQ